MSFGRDPIRSRHPRTAAAGLSQAGREFASEKQNKTGTFGAAVLYVDNREGHRFASGKGARCV
jgi:hypothetical protein